MVQPKDSLISFSMIVSMLQSQQFRNGKSPACIQQLCYFLPHIHPPLVAWRLELSFMAPEHKLRHGNFGIPESGPSKLARDLQGTLVDFRSIRLFGYRSGIGVEASQIVELKRTRTS
jgi:hypothetical protein